MMFLWSYCLLWWQWLARPWPWSWSPPLSSREYAVVSLWCLHEWWIIFDIYACVSVCACASLALDQCTRSLTSQELTRGYVYFTVKTLKQTLNVAQAPQAGWLVTKGRLTLIGFDSRGVATLPQPASRGAFLPNTYLSTQHTYTHVPVCVWVWVRVCASWQPLRLGLCRQTYLHMLAAYFNKSCWISCRTDSRYTHRYSLTLTRRWVACLFDNS